VRALALDLVAAFGRHGARHSGERISQLHHALQCAGLARAAGADDDLVLTALLHDIGHLVRDRAPVSDGQEENADHHHGHEGADLARPFVPARVAWLIEHHVVAKRYLCTVEPGYAAGLSPASARSFVAQGGALPAWEVEQLEEQPWFADAVRVRRWDDLAKDPAAVVPPLADYVRLLERYFGPQSLAGAT
jgi:gamma-butyrobetaine dioxygenase